MWPSSIEQTDVFHKNTQLELASATLTNYLILVKEITDFMARTVTLMVLYLLSESIVVTCSTLDSVIDITVCEKVPSLHFDLYCITPICDVPCPSDCESRCNTLQFYTSNAPIYFKSNTKFLFVNGTFLHTSSFTVERVTNLNFTSFSPTESPVIQCSQSHQVGFIFNNCSQITIKNMAFFNCGQQLYTPHHQRSHAALAFINGSHLVLDNVIISDSPVQGLLVFGVQGNISIKESKFSRAGYGHDQINSDSNDIAGNSVFAEYNNTKVNIVIRDSEFIDNSNRPTCVEANTPADIDDLRDCKHLASGLALILRRSNVSVELSNSIFKNNRGCLGGNLAVVFNTTYPFHGDVSIRDCHIINGTAVLGGGLYIYYLSAPDSNNPCSLENNGSVINLTTIANTTFEDNIALTGGGLYAGLTESLAICIPNKILITNDCLFQHNTLSYAGFGGVAIHSMNFLSFGYKNQILLQFFLVIQESQFMFNYYSNDSKWKNSGSGVIYIKTNRHAEIENIAIYGNQYSGIVIVDSNLVVSGSVDVYNNSGSSGGGMLFCSNSIMFLTPDTNITIANNTVEHAGGGICVEGQCIQSRPLCFFQPGYEAAVDPKLNRSIKIILYDNTAKYAGDQIYGGTIDYCYLMNSPYHNVSLHKQDSVEVFKQLFQYYPNNSQSVTSPQRHVCLCYKTNDSETMEHDCTANHSESLHGPFYPGEPFALSAVVVGQLNGKVPGTVYAELKSISQPGVHQTLGRGEGVQKIFQKACTDLNYTIYTNYYNATLVLSIQFIGDKSFTEHLKFYKPLEIAIAIKECPLGFYLQGKSCDCLQKLQNGFHCNISNTTIIPKRGYWIGYSAPSRLNQTILYSTGCTVDYCKNTHLDYVEGSVGVKSRQTTFSDQDRQCQFQRTGVLCGSCSINSSVMLGSSQCSNNCANTSLLLIPLFIAMGVLLVLVLMVLNMTVTEGTINGLLFYANIVQISNVVFFRGTNIPFLSSLFKGFIAWLNLDFGVSTCLYSGMDDYVKAWLQFAFPLYIWLITGIIIYLSRHFTFVARLVKRNGVNVLATLILISYSKMVRATIVAIHFKILYHLDPNGSINTITLCWYSDCNVQYMKGKHILLGIVGFILVLSLLPFAFLLLFSDLLNKIKCCSFLWRLKPFLDAYTGPYTDEGRYWTGLLLVVRIILFTASGFNHSNGVTSINVTLGNIVVVLLLILPWLLRTSIYHKRWLNVLECSFLLNLGALTTGTQYIFYYKQRQEWLTHLSIGFAFITFVMILIYHFCQLKSIKSILSKIMKCCVWNLKKDIVINSETQNTTQCDSDEDLLSQFPPLVRFDQDREPLLSYTD